MAELVYFLDCVLDAANASLQRGGRSLDVRPKALAVLAYLSQRPNQLVTKSELLDAVWTDTAVGEWVLTTAIKELRQALDDDARQPRAIETIHGRGYRFIAAVRSAEVESRTASADTASHVSAAETEDSPATPPLAGRAAELEELRHWCSEALRGRRQIGFIVGEPGIGKTALVNAFVDALSAPQNDASARPNTLFACGQCVEQYSGTEAYLPVIEALGRLTSMQGGESFSELVRRLAPSWLPLWPAIASGTPSSPHVSPSPERMLREIVSVLEALPVPLVLVLEDLHWSDFATLDLIARLANGRDPARLFVIATYRPVEVALRGHPLKKLHHELRARGRCRDLWLAPLTTLAIAHYLGARFPGLTDTEALAAALQRITDGNALFMINVVDEWIAQGVFAPQPEGWRLGMDLTSIRVQVPNGLRQLITLRLEHYAAAERTVLEAASIVGRTFSAAEAAAALESSPMEVEKYLEPLARRQDIVRAAARRDWPDGTVSAGYEFAHALYHEVLAASVPPATSRAFHTRVAARLEAAYAPHTEDVAAQLALHFEAGGMAEHALSYLEEAAARASKYGADRESAALLERGVGILNDLPTTPERTLRAIRFHLALGQAQQTAHGFASIESQQAYERARELSIALDDPVQLFQATTGVMSTQLGRTEFAAALELAKQLPLLAARLPLPAFVFTSHLFQAIAEYHAGDLRQARRHLDAAAEIGEIPQPLAFMNLWVVCLSYLALTLTQQGYPDQARQRALQAQHRAATESPFVRANAATWTVFASMTLRDTAMLAEISGEALRLGEENGFTMPLVVGRVAQGWLSAERGDHQAGIKMMDEAIEEYRSSGQATVALPAMLGKLSEAHLLAGDFESALERAKEARDVIESTGETRYAPEALRLEGAAQMARGEPSAAADLFQRAIDLARRQGARWWELRAQVCLSKLKQQQGDIAAARETLAELLASYEEGRSDTPDLREAHALLILMRQQSAS